MGNWYSVAVSTLLLGCGGSTEVTEGHSGGAGNIDSGTPAATGGAMVAFYGMRMTGGANSIDGGGPAATGGMMVAYYGVRTTGGTSPMIPSTGGHGSIDAGTPAAVGGSITTDYGVRVSGGASGTCPATVPKVGTPCVGDIACDYGQSIDCAYPCSEPGCALESKNGAPITSDVRSYFVCLGSWTTYTIGTCPTSADCRCGDAAAQDRNTQLAASCVASGGKVITSECCTATSDFPRTCNSTGACSCGPGYTRPTLQCACSAGCFDGTSCVL